MNPKLDKHKKFTPRHINFWKIKAEKSWKQPEEKKKEKWWVTCKETSIQITEDPLSEATEPEQILKESSTMYSVFNKTSLREWREIRSYSDEDILSKKNSLLAGLPINIG